ncbi:helix-turn-helix domain-containing protein [Phyllobacterium sp. BT25]|uniref:Helix-turn-helix domain-containing protein n=1 Tax=Phyllobacterium pellucidum TaxID=2740464 RepID=A0A849VYI3_9HYPH|nr:helix-turn-helix transcriptional regulator [Phyllobacterium pellucidum]NTS33894.1 helix-turn-helix domain-containing protein [Phyllobacterium pellucidum]
MPACYAYARNTATFKTDKQFAAIKAVSLPLGIVTYTMHTENEIGGEDILLALIDQLRANDTLLIADIFILSPRPSRLLALLCEVVGKGVRVVAASLAGEINLPLLRSYTVHFVEMEEKLLAAEAKLIERERLHRIEMDTYASEYEAHLLKLLQKHGVNLLTLVRPANALEGDAPKNPAQGRELREMREKLGLTGEQAGALCQPVIGKSQVSRIESEGSGAAHYENLKYALVTAEVLARYDQTRRAKAIEKAIVRPAQIVEDFAKSRIAS